MSGKTVVLWLKSDNKTVQETTIDESHKHLGKRHYVYLHGSGELYTSRNFIPAKQLQQIVERYWKKV